MIGFQDNQALWLDYNTTLSMDIQINCVGLARIDFLYSYRLKDILFIVN